MNGDYQAYLIRFQRGDGQVHWRVRLENASNGEILRFATERDLFHYLMDELEVIPEKEISKGEGQSKI